MAQVAFGVVAHESRRAAAETLAEQVGACYIAVDDGTYGAGANHRRVWQHLANTGSQWCVTLEDDAQPVDNFAAHTHTALTYAPSKLVSFYLGHDRRTAWSHKAHKAIENAHQQQCAWITHNHLLSAVAIALPTSLITDMLANTSTRLNIDDAISAWARWRRHKISYTVPSLVNHDDTMPSIAAPACGGACLYLLGDACA